MKKKLALFNILAITITFLAQAPSMAAVYMADVTVTNTGTTVVEKHFDGTYTVKTLAPGEQYVNDQVAHTYININGQKYENHKSAVYTNDYKKKKEAKKLRKKQKKLEKLQKELGNK